MKVTVLKSFPCANEQGRDVQLIEAGEQEVRDELVAGLVAEGFIAQPANMAPVPMSHGRRKAMIEALIDEGRRQMEAASDEQLLSAFEHLEASKRPAEPDPQGHLDLQTKVDAPDQTGAPQPLNLTDADPPEARATVADAVEPPPAKPSRRAK